MDYYDSEYLRSKCELEEEDEIPMRISEAYDSYERLVLRARSGSRVHLSQFVDMAEHLKDRIESYKSRTAPKGKDPVPCRDAVELWKAKELKHGDMVGCIYRKEDREGRFLGQLQAESNALSRLTASGVASRWTISRYWLLCNLWPNLLLPFGSRTCGRRSPITLGMVAASTSMV